MCARAGHFTDRMPPLVAHSAPVWSVIAQHLAHAIELMAGLRAVPFEMRPRDTHVGLCVRCDAHLDALRIAGPAGLEAAERALAGDAEAAGALALLLADVPPGAPGGAEATARLTALLTHGSPEVADAAWWGLRLARPCHLAAHLAGALVEPSATFACAAAVDVLTFHRQSVPAHARTPVDFTHWSDAVTWLAVESAGRGGRPWADEHLAAALRHTAPVVRSAALRAAARRGMAVLAPACRAAVAHPGPSQAIAFLGVVGERTDVERLQRLAEASDQQPDVRLAAVQAVGRLGYAVAVPWLLARCADATLAPEAVAAAERLTGQPVPRAASLAPAPHDADPDEWDSTPPIDVAQAEAWWAGVRSGFDEHERWQAGRRVSIAPLGPTFHDLPLAVAYDAYLRERALASRTPDWELETWAWRQRDPGEKQGRLQ